MCRKVIVVDDTGALLAALPFYLPAYHVTPPETIQEIKDSESRLKLENMIEINRITIMPPSEDSVKIAEKLVKRINLYNKLSRTDLKVLALSLEFREKCKTSEVLVATDDYALQYAVKKAGLKFTPIRYKGIK